MATSVRFRPCDWKINRRRASYWRPVGELGGRERLHGAAEVDVIADGEREEVECRPWALPLGVGVLCLGGNGCLSGFALVPGPSTGSHGLRSAFRI